MTVEEPKRDAVPAEAIPDFPELYPRPVGINRFTVLSLSNEEPTAYQVDLEDLSCTCPDYAYNRQDGAVCKHLAAALYQARGLTDVDTEAVKSLANELEGLKRDVNEAMVRSAEAKAETASNGHSADSDSSEEEGDGWNGDPVESMTSLLRSAGLDPDDFEVWVDEQYGSLQVDQDGYLDDDDFSEWVDLSSDLGMDYDNNNEVNYLKPDRFPEVFG